MKTWMVLLLLPPWPTPAPVSPTTLNTVMDAQKVMGIAPYFAALLLIIFLKRVLDHILD